MPVQLIGARHITKAAAPQPTSYCRHLPQFLFLSSCSICIGMRAGAVSQIFGDSRELLSRPSSRHVSTSQPVTRRGMWCGDVATGDWLRRDVVTGCGGDTWREEGRERSSCESPKIWETAPAFIPRQIEQLDEKRSIGR
ncbi:hypothetical protein Sjap_013547 [Stephania japonica]|uniref:Uncharacterized protein n=1 Tax=Stephania japonica TaxID=461633 RepID=A0AAP0IZB0_9MAGN